MQRLQSQDGELVAAGQKDGTVTVFRRGADGWTKELQKPHKMRVRTVCFAGTGVDRILLVGCDDARVHVYAMCVLCWTIFCFLLGLITCPYGLSVGLLRPKVGPMIDPPRDHIHPLPKQMREDACNMCVSHPCANVLQRGQGVYRCTDGSSVVDYMPCGQSEPQALTLLRVEVSSSSLLLETKGRGC